MKQVLLFLTLFSFFSLSAQNEFILPVNGELFVTECSGTLYDDGGANANYADNSGSFALFEIPDGSYIDFSFTEFDVEINFDNLSIYSVANEFDEPVLVGSYDGAELPNDGNPISVFGEGALIFFATDGSVNRPGFAVDFACADFTDAPIAAAGFPTQTCTGTVNFSDNSTGFANNWTWDFGDGNTSTQENPTHTYTEPGSYLISLVACNDNGCDTYTADFPILFDPEAEICSGGESMIYQGVGSSSNCTGVLYDNGGLEGNYLNSSNDQFYISPPNASEITLTFLSFDLGNLGEHTDMFYVYDTNTFMVLDVFDGTELPNGGAPITYNVPEIIIYFVSDHSNDFSGFSLLWEADGTAAAPLADFSIATNNVPLNSPISFTDASENAGAWSWDFGNGSTSNLQNPTFTYTSPGTYEVSLTVNNCNGSDVSETQIITVQDAPEFTFSPGSFAVTLDAGTTGTETLNLCNVGAGDLTLSLTNQGSSNNFGYRFGFTTNENGADFSWQILDIDFNVVQESQQTFAANQTYIENMTGLDENQEYYLFLNSPIGVQSLESLTWYDPNTNEVLYEGL